ncbi:hypothetical protein D3C74_320830 [compost metagenome]
MLIDQRTVQVEHLVKVRVQHVAQCQGGYHNRNRDQRRNSNIDRLFPAPCPIHFRSFIQGGTDSGQSGQEDNHVEPEFLPDITENDREPEPAAVAQEEYRLNAEDTGNELVDEPRLGKHVNQNPRKSNP